MGSKGGGSSQSGFQATTSTYTPNPEAMAAYRQALGMASNVSQIPYEAYQGQRVAGLTEDQMAAMQGVREMQGMTQPYIDAATKASMAGLAYADPRRFSQEALQQYYNPYQQNVINATMANIDEMNRAQQNQLTGRIVSSGAMGGDRAGIARAELARQQNLVNQQTMAQLQAQGYGQAVNQYNQQQQQAIAAAQSGAYSLGQLGMQSQQAAMQGLQALLGTGGMQQQLGQQQLDAAFQAYQAARAYPYQQANFYSGIASGIAPNMGGTTNTIGFGSSNQQQPAPSGASQGLGLLTSALSFLPMLSDERTKENVDYIGTDERTGLPIVAYDDKGDRVRAELYGEPMPPKRVSFMAQDVEQAYPEAVTDLGGLKGIDGRMLMSDGGSAPAWGDQLSQAQYLNPNVPQGLEAVINPAMAHQMEQSKWVAHNADQDVNPYFDQSYTTPSQFIQQEPQMRADGGMVDWKKLPYGEPNPIEKPSFPFGTPRPQEPKAPDMGYLPSLPGGPKSGGAGGGGGGGSGGLGDLGKQISKLTKTMGKSHDAPHADTAHAPMAEPAAAAPVAEPAAPVAPAADLGAIQTPDILGGLGGLFGGMGFEHGGRVGYADGGSPAGGGSAGGLGDVSFGAPGAGYSGLLGRAMDWAKGAGEPPSPESMGLGSLQTEGPMYKPRTPLPSTWAVESQGKENPSMVPLMMMGAGGKFGNLGLLATIAGQQQAAGAAGERAQLGKTRESMLAQPRQPVGRFFDLYAPPNSNRPPRVGTSGLFPMMATGNYYMPQYKDGGRIAAKDGGGFNYGPSMQLYYDLVNSGKMTPQAAAGYAGNFSYESMGRGSQLNPGSIEGGQPFEKAGLGYAQWTNPKRGPVGRHTDFLNYAKETGRPWQEHLTNVDFFNKERMENPVVRRADEAVQQQETIPAATSAVMHKYERPHSYESLPERTHMAEHIGDIAQAGNPFKETQLADYTTLPHHEPVVAADAFTTGGGFADGGSVGMARGGGLDERTASLANRAMNFFLSKGYSRAAASGIVGNLIHESGGHLNPAAHGDLNLGAARSAWGIGQWRENRFRNLQNFAKAIGRDWKDFDTQLAFVDRELKTDYRDAYRNISSAKTPQQAAANMMMYYEIPSHKIEGVPSTYRGWNDRLRLSNMLAGQDYAPTTTTASEPVKTLSVRPVTGERAGVAAEPRPSVLTLINPNDPSGPLRGQTAPDYTKISPRSNVVQMPSPTRTVEHPAAPRKGFSLADLNPIGTAHADEMAPTLSSGVIPRVRPGFESIQGPGQLAGTQTIKQLQPGALTAPIGMPRTGIYDTDVTAFSPPGMGGDRDLYGAKPQGFGTFAPTDLSPAGSQPWEQPPVAQDEPAKEAPASVREPAAKPIERAAPAPAEKGLFFGDYRDYEPWKSDPIGSAIDEMMGETPHSKHKGASMWDVGGGETSPASLGDLFRAHGGRTGMAEGGDPLAYLDPEVFSSEPMAKPAGFDRAIVEPEPEAEEPVVATDRPIRTAPAARPVAQQRGLDIDPRHWSPEVSQALLAAGLGMMAGTSPYAAVNIGQGGLAGLEVYQAARQQRMREEATEAERQAAADKEKQRQEFIRRAMTTEPPKVSSVRSASPTAALDAEYDRLANLLAEAPDSESRQAISAKMRAIETQISRKQGKLGVIGRDEFGRPITGWVSGENVGQPFSPPETEKRTVSKDAGLRGDDFLNTLEPDMAERVKAIAEGRQELPKGRLMEPIVRAVTQYDPSYTTQRKKTRDAFADTSPTKAGGQIIAGNTALGHLGELSDAAHALGNSGFKLWNWAKQHGRSMTSGNPELEVFEATKDRFIEEATKFYRGSGGTEADIQRALGRMSAAATPQELDKVIAQEAKLFESKVSALEDQWRKNMGSDLVEAGNEDYGVIRGHAKEALEKIQSRAGGKDKGTSSVDALAKKYDMTPEQLRAKYEQMKQGRQ